MIKFVSREEIIDSILDAINEANEITEEQLELLKALTMEESE